MANPLLPPLLGTAFTSIAAPVVTFFLTRGSGQKAHLENLDSQTIATLSDRVSELEHSKYDLEIRNDKLAEDNSNLRQTNLELSATIREKSIQLSEATLNGMIYPLNTRLYKVSIENYSY